MKNNKHFMLLSMTLVAVSVMSACTGILPPASTDDAIPTVSVIASNTPALPTASVTLQIGSAVEVEIFGVVESMTETTVSVNGVTYNIVADFTEFNDVISVGDQVKIHVIVNADGTFTIREIELSVGNDNDNSNNNTNEANSNDDNGNESNSNDDNGNDSNSNDDGNNNDSSSGSDGNDNGGNDNDSNDNG